MNWLQKIIYGEPQELKLSGDNLRARTTMPKPPMLDVSHDSLLRYSRKNEIVYACIEKKAQAACDAELVVEKRNGEGNWERQEMHPLIALLNKPNPYDDGESFRRSWIASENFADAFYCEVLRNSAGQPVELYPLNPAYLTEVYKSTRDGDVLDYYAYRVNGREVRFAPEELLVRRRHGLGNIYSNTSAVAVALGSVDADLALTDYVRAFFNNGGQPSGILSIEGRSMSDAEVEQMQQRWTARFGRGGKNQGGVAVMDKTKATYEAVGSRLNEIDSDGITGKIETRICMAFGVPPVIIGAYVGLLHVNQKASFKGAMEEFWMNTMSPELKSIRNFLTWNLLPEFVGIEEVKKGNWRVNWDMSQVDALQEDVDAVFTRIGGAVKDGIITVNEARAKLGYDEIDGGDELQKPQMSGGPEADPPKMLNPAPEVKSIIEAEIIEKKTFEFDGLTLSREPTPLEQSLDLKKIVEISDADREKLKAVLMSLRELLIDEAVKIFSSLADGDLFQLVLTPPSQIYKRVKRILADAYSGGMDKLREELERQGASVAFGVKESDIVQQLTDLTVSRVVNEMQTRTINQVATMGVLQLETAEIKTKLGTALREQSDKWLDGYSGAAVNTATQRGRNDTIRATEDIWDYLEYSAILDAKLCDTCRQWDGKKADKYDDLPDTPNAGCEGADRCRCFIVAVYDSQ